MGTFLPEVLPTTAVLVALLGVGLLAFEDVRTRKVDGWSTIVLAVSVCFAFLIGGVSLTQWLWAAGCGAAAFLLYLELGIAGRMGGGDVKLIPIPVAVVAAINPVLAVWSVLLIFAVQNVLQLTNRLVFRSRDLSLPHVPAIWAGFVGSILLLSAITGA